MRILHILGDSKWGGGTAVVLALAALGRSEGWSVDVLSTDSATMQAAKELGCGAIGLDAIRREIRPLSDLRGLNRLYRFLNGQRYDLVHTHTSKAGFAGRIAATMARTPAIVHTIHGFAFHERSPALERLPYVLLEKAAARCCHRVVTVSHFHRAWALELGIAPASKLGAIPNGIAEPLASRERAWVRQELGLRRDDFAVLSNSRLAGQKGLEDLLRAAALLDPFTASRVKILLAGEGALRPKLEALTAQLQLDGMVRFLGFRGDMPDLLNASDAVALPSLREGLSIAMLEAMAAGKAVIATSISSMSEVARGGEAALLVPVECPAALAAAIEKLSNDPDLAGNLGRRAREVYLESYTLDRMTAAYRVLYKDLLMERLPGRSPAPSFPERIAS